MSRVEHLDLDALIKAALAYDAERMRLNRQWHGSKEQPMSEANLANITPMLAACIRAYLAAVVKP